MTRFQEEASVGYVGECLKSLDLKFLKSFTDTTTLDCGEPSERVIVLKFLVPEPVDPKKPVPHNPFGVDGHDKFCCCQPCYEICKKTQCLDKLK